MKENTLEQDPPCSFSVICFFVSCSLSEVHPLSVIRDGKYSSSTEVTAPASATFASSRTNPLASYTSITDELAAASTSTSNNNNNNVSEEIIEQVQLASS